MSQITFDEQMMLRAIEYGEHGRVTAPPNPWVGCVIAKEGQVIGEGFHRAAGEPHAEVNALKSIADPTGTTAYVTLEPCSHFGRTPPCVEALIKARMARVVVALEDPDPRVSGTGIKRLREAGIEVVTGVCSSQAFASLQPYLHQRKTGRAFCVLKAAESIDGRTAAADQTSQWITGVDARQNVQKLRAESQAILIGAGTALADNPQLTVRDTFPLPTHPPLRVLLDATGKVKESIKLFDTFLAPTLIVTSALCPPRIQKEWINHGAEVVTAPLSPITNGIDLDAVLQILGQRGILQVLVEGGATVSGSFLKQGLVDRLVIYIGPRLLGETGLPLFKNFTVDTMANAPTLKLVQSMVLGDSVRIDYSF